MRASHDEHEDGRGYDIQYVQVAWSLTKSYGPGTPMIAQFAYLIGPALNRDWDYFKPESLGQNIRGLRLGEWGAINYTGFESFVNDFCKDDCQK